MITPLETVSLGKPESFSYFRSWDNMLLLVLEQKPLEVINAAIDALEPFQDKIDILLALKCTSNCGVKYMWRLVL